jgi:hypothetical protein
MKKIRLGTIRTMNKAEHVEDMVREEGVFEQEK